MNGLRSPDIPAHLSYGLVFLVGTLVAIWSVNKLLAEQRERWAHLPTWILLAGYALLPVGLFWFLDYNGVVSDTSLFAALVTAAAYQQIFSDGVEGIRLPGQSRALWKAFEVWANRVQHRIDKLTQARNVRFTEDMVGRVASSPQLTQVLTNLALGRSRAHATLVAELQKVNQANQNLSPEALNRAVVKTLWDDLRVSEPDNYGRLLEQSQILTGREYWLSFRNGRSIVMSFVVLIILAVGGYYGYQISKPSHGNIWLAWQGWRFARPSITASDEFRNRSELLKTLNGDDVRGAGLAESLAAELTYRDVSVETAQRIVDFFLYAHSDTVTPRFVEPLIAALRTPNPDVRLRIHRTLLDLQVVQFEKTPLTGEFEPLAKWVPAKEDSAGTIDGYMQKWRRWWKKTQEPPKPTAVETDLLADRPFIVSDVLFETRLWTVQPSALGILQEVADALIKHSGWMLLIEGHTDDVGEDAYNLRLSQRRADAVVEQLIKVGIAESRLTAVGKGERVPRVKDTSEEARSKNRRVEFKRIDAASSSPQRR